MKTEGSATKKEFYTEGVRVNKELALDSFRMGLIDAGIFSAAVCGEVASIISNYWPGDLLGACGIALGAFGSVYAYNDFKREMDWIAEDQAVATSTEFSASQSEPELAN